MDARTREEAIREIGDLAGRMGWKPGMNTFRRNGNTKGGGAGTFFLRE